MKTKKVAERTWKSGDQDSIIGTEPEPSLSATRDDKDSIELHAPLTHVGEVRSKELHLPRISARLGREMFLQSFMALDYLEFRLLRQKSKWRFLEDASVVEQVNEFEVDSKLDSSPACDPLPFKSEKQAARSDQANDHVAPVKGSRFRDYVVTDRGDVPGWVLVVLMTTGLVTAIWAIAAPKLNAILKNSLDSMNNIR